jgi:hypothetical protein
MASRVRGSRSRPAPATGGDHGSDDDRRRDEERAGTRGATRVLDAPDAPDAPADARDDTRPGTQPGGDTSTGASTRGLGDRRRVGAAAHPRRRRHGDRTSP